MKMKDYLYSEKPNFENRLLFAQLTSPYDCYSDSKYGYLDGAKECLESYKTIEDLEVYINEFERKFTDRLDEYDKAYILAYRDYIKQHQGDRKWENL